TDIARLRALASADSGPDPGELSGFYGGDFLSEVDNAGDSANWIVSLRATCRELAAAILEKSISTVAKSDSADVAILRARELVSLDPLDEKSHRILIRLYADDGQRSKAIAQFQSCRQMLQLELGVEPSAETIRLADDVAVRSASALSDLKEIATTRNQTESATMSTPGPTPASDGDDVSIAVLPFVNMSGDADQDYFAEGVSEDIATDLSKVANLSVAGASSSRPYRAASMRPDEIATELGVRHLLEGSVRRSDENVRITTRLIEG
ncbi:MAG: hypothetical protein GY788_27070, partial [bacterium]|nr:hypothetical protein [bacterium]